MFFRFVACPTIKTLFLFPFLQNFKRWWEEGDSGVFFSTIQSSVQGPVHILGYPRNKQDKATGTQHDRTSRQDDMTNLQDDRTSREDDMTNRQDDRTSRQDDTTSRQDDIENRHRDILIPIPLHNLACIHKNKYTVQNTLLT